jgi:hypothetical protein
MKYRKKMVCISIEHHISITNFAKMYLHLQYMDIRANGPYKIIKNASGNFV